MTALEQVRGVIRALQTSMMVLMAKIVNNVYLKILTVLAKRLILDTWMGPGRGFADQGDWYITALKIQAKIFKDGRQVIILIKRPYLKFESWANYETTIKSISSVPFSRMFIRKIFCRSLSKHLWWSLYLVKFHAFSIFFLTSFRRMLLKYKNYYLRRILFWTLKQHQTTKTSS